MRCFQSGELLPRVASVASRARGHRSRRARDTHKMHGALPLCRGDEQNAGSWAALSGPPAGTPPCCGYHRAPSKQPAVCAETNLATVGGRACTCVGMRNVSYEWRPSRCRLHEWDARRFCQLLAGRRILFAGDSTMGQLAAVFQNFVAWGFADDRPLGPRGGGLADSASNGGATSCASQLVFGQADTLTHKALGRMNRGKSLGSLLRRLSPALAIVSAGPHVYGDANFEAVLRYTANASAYRMFGNTTVVWKTQGPAGCSGRAPLRELPDRGAPMWEAARRANVSLFNHPEFVERDRVAKRFFSGLAAAAAHRRRHRIGGLLDLTPLLYRADAHISSELARGFAVGGARSRDCMHLCYGADGGPLALVPRLLLHALETRQIVILPPQAPAAAQLGASARGRKG